MSEQIISLQVHVAHDDEANVWYVAKSEIPGLSLEAKSVGALVERILEAAPELLELNEGLCIEGASAHVNEPRLDMPELRQARPRPRMSVLPIFDTPVELARA